MRAENHDPEICGHGCVGTHCVRRRRSRQVQMRRDKSPQSAGECLWCQLRNRIEENATWPAGAEQSKRLAMGAAESSPAANARQQSRKTKAPAHRRPSNVGFEGIKPGAGFGPGAPPGPQQQGSTGRSSFMSSRSVTTRSSMREMDCGGPVWSVKLSADNKMVVTGDDTGKVSLWDVQHATLLRSMECDGKVSAVDLATDQSFVLSSDLSGAITIWATASGERLRTMTCNSAVNSVMLSRDATTVLSGDDVRAQSQLSCAFSCRHATDPSRARARRSRSPR